MTNADLPARIFVHGLESSGQGTKATLLRTIYPDILTPDFVGPLEERMSSLAPILAQGSAWIIVGSSFGGLMAALWTCSHPDRVRKLVLLAPALHHPAFAQSPPPAVDVPTVLFHGSRDDIVPLETVRALATATFRNLSHYVVDDEHALRKTAAGLDWRALLAGA